MSQRSASCQTDESLFKGNTNFRVLGSPMIPKGSGTRKHVPFASPLLRSVANSTAPSAKVSPRVNLRTSQGLLGA